MLPSQFFCNEKNAIYPDNFNVRSIVYPIDGLGIVDKFPTIYILDKSSIKTKKDIVKVNNVESAIEKKNEAVDIIQYSKIRYYLEVVMFILFLLLNVMWYLNTLSFRTFDREYLINESFEKYFTSVFPSEVLVDKQNVLSNIKNKLINLYIAVVLITCG